MISDWGRIQVITSQGKTCKKYRAQYYSVSQIINLSVHRELTLVGKRNPLGLKSEAPPRSINSLARIHPRAKAAGISAKELNSKPLLP